MEQFTWEKHLTDTETVSLVQREGTDKYFHVAFAWCLTLSHASFMCLYITLLASLLWPTLANGKAQKGMLHPTSRATAQMDFQGSHKWIHSALGEREPEG